MFRSTLREFALYGVIIGLIAGIWVGIITY